MSPASRPSQQCSLLIRILLDEEQAVAGIADADARTPQGEGTRPSWGAANGRRTSAIRRRER